MALFDEFPCLDDAAQEIADAWNDNNNFTSARIIERDEANVALAAALARAIAAEALFNEYMLLTLGEAVGVEPRKQRERRLEIVDAWLNAHPLEASK
jgi:hypothetical protein